jgi:hypothetical protein
MHIQDRYVWVDGSQTGIPLSEVTVVEPPAPIPVATLTTLAKSGPSDKEGDGSEISVLVTPQGRLQISADLDVKGLGKLNQMLEQYEQILKRVGCGPLPVHYQNKRAAPVPSLSER